MIKSSVFANKKISSGLNVFGTPANSSGATTSSSFFDNSLQQHVIQPTTTTTTTGRNWQATPTNSRRLAAAFPIQSLLHPSNSSTSLRNPIMAPTAAISNTPSMRVKPYTLSGLVETLNEALADLAIPHSLRYETKYGFEDILTVLDHLVNPSRYEQKRFQPFPPLPQPTKAGGKISLTDRWAYLKHVLLAYRLSTVEQLSRIKPERNMSNEHVMILIDLLIQLTKCLARSEREQERISQHNYLREFKLLMRQMFWIGRYDPSVMEESMLELKHHIYARDHLEEIDRLKYDRQIHEMTIERDQLKQQFDALKTNCQEIEQECSQLTSTNDLEQIELTKKQEELAEEQAKLIELSQIVEQKEMDKKHLVDRNQTLSDRLFSQQTDGELQRHIRSNGELKQQHEVLLSTLLLEQQLHSTASNEQKRLVKELQDSLGKYQILLSAYKHKVNRQIPSAVDFDLSDVIGESPTNSNQDAVKQAQIAIEQLAKEMINQELMLTERHRNFEQESKKRIEELQSAEREWKSAAKHGQRRAAQQNELSRFQQEIRSIRMKIVDLERKIDEKKSSTIELKKEFERIKLGTTELFTRFESLETNYLQKNDELRRMLNYFLVDQNQLAKCFRRDVEELRRMQQEHLSKLEINTSLTSFDDLIQEQIRKFYFYKHVEDDDDDEEDENPMKIIRQFDKIHDVHLSALKKKKKTTKLRAPLVERFQELFDNLNLVNSE